MCKSEISATLGSVSLSFRAMGIKAQALFLSLQGTDKELGRAERGWW